VYQASSQGFTRQTYHDADKKHLKEVYQVKDTVRNVLHGKYISYYLNGNIESKGQFANNETIGIWEFYFETGKLKMRGILRKNSNYGLWEYFYESGEKSMEGTINGKNREGEWKSYYENGNLKESGLYLNNKRVSNWKMYFEDGVLKGEINYVDDFGVFKEYYHSGKLFGEGSKLGARDFGHWRFFTEDGTLQREGDYTNGKKNGNWIMYYPSGKVASRGNYNNDKPDGKWEYFYEDGKVSNSGEYLSGKKNGLWKAYYPDGSLKSAGTFIKGTGECVEYHINGQIKTKGQYVDDRREGQWQFFYINGKLEGECTYEKGNGIYVGYFPTGGIQTKGTMEEDAKVGTWELYEKNGELSGYYRPFYDDRTLGKEITALAGTRRRNKTQSGAKRFHYFDSRPGEFTGIIVESNPIFTFVGSLPLGIEIYHQERLGHQFEFTGIRDPFFIVDSDIDAGKLFSRGCTIAIKQKFYNSLKMGLWYFGHEIRFTNINHFTNRLSAMNPDISFTAAALEQRIEWGPLLGYRIMRSNKSKGITADLFVSYNIGYRAFKTELMSQSYFEELNQSAFSKTLHIGLNIGHVFAFEK